MKKYFFTAVAALTIAASGVTYMQNQKPIAMNDLALENVEALAYSVSEGGSYVGQCCPPWSESCSYTNGYGPGRAQSIVVISCY